MPSINLNPSASASTASPTVTTAPLPLGTALESPTLPLGLPATVTGSPAANPTGRLVMGPSFSNLTIEASPGRPANPPAGTSIVPPTGSGPAGVVKQDVEVTCEEANLDKEPLEFLVKVPPYDLATYNKLNMLHVVVVPQGQTLPTTAVDFLASPFPKGSYDVSAIQDGNGGQPVIVPVTDSYEGLATGQIILEFAE